MLATIVAAAAVRPRYGGMLRLHVLEMPPLETLAGETLLALDEKGRPVAGLAAGWKRDAARKRWILRLRPGVLFHDGTPLSAAAAADALKALGAEVQGDAISLDAPLEIITRTRVVKPNSAIGTGPFSVKQAGSAVILQANERHWAGRPFLDSIEITSGTDASRRIAADIFETPVSTIRRSLPEDARLWTSRPETLLALDVKIPAEHVRQALAQAIDRAAIANVILQRRAEPAYSVLPNWMSGYAFLFARPPDPAAARQKLAGHSPGALSIGYATQDPVARSVAERVAVNARDAGILLNVRPEGADVRVVRLAAELPGEAASSPQQQYEREMALLTSSSLIPIAHLPQLFVLSPGVRNWTGMGRLAEVWMAP